MTTTPHDALFKAVFSRPENAAAALKPLLREALAEATDWTSLTLEPGSYIDEELVERQTDLLFRADIAGTESRFYLLFEHLSEPDARMPFRLLRYMIRIWEQIEHNEKDKPLPPIIPVVLSHSERGWQVPTSFEDTLELGAMREHVLPHVPRFRYIVDDLTQATDAQLEARISSLYVRIVMLLFRDGRRLPVSLVFSQYADLLRSLIGTTPLEAIELLIRYALLLAGDYDREGLLTVLGTIPTKQDESMRNLANSILEVSIAKGRTEGVAQGRIEGRVEGARAMLRKQMQLKFGSVSAQVDAKVEGASMEQLEMWIERVLTSQSADDIVG
jgi:predicted transposase YdaD